MRGGYKIINLKDKLLMVGTQASIKGVYNSIESNYRKALLLTGITIDSVEKPDVFITLSHNGNKYTGLLYGYTLEINSDDKVEIKNV